MSNENIDKRNLKERLKAWQVKTGEKLSGLETRTIENVITGLRASVRDVVLIAQAYTKLVDERQALHEAFIAASDMFPRTFWVILDQVGRGQLDYRLTYLDSTVRNRVARLTLKVQDQLVREGVPIITLDGVVYKSIYKISPSVAKRVFVSGKLIPPAQQEMIEVEGYLRKMPKTSKKAKLVVSDWLKENKDKVRITYKTISVFQPCVIPMEVIMAVGKLTRIKKK